MFPTLPFKSSWLTSLLVLILLNGGVELTLAGEEMKSLEFLIGSWHGTASVGGEESHARVEYAWMNQKNFVKQTIFLGDAQLVHIIGWDPVTSSLRTWGFGGRGGHGEMAWTKLDDRSWKEEAEDWVAPTGSKARFLLETKITGDELVIDGFFEEAERTKISVKAKRAHARRRPRP